MQRRAVAAVQLLPQPEVLRMGKLQAALEQEQVRWQAQAQDKRPPQRLQSKAP